MIINRPIYSALKNKKWGKIVCGVMWSVYVELVGDLLTITVATMTLIQTDTSNA